MVIDYKNFSEQMRPLSEDILNSLKLKETNL